MRAIILLALCLGLARLASADGLLVVANAKVPEAQISFEELMNIYRIRKVNWSNDLAIVPVNREASSRERQQFTERVFNRSTMELADYWNRLRFQGKIPPVVQNSDQSVVGFVRNIPGAIGYINDTSEHAGVKVLLRLE
jgi:ABC-type phosphate transport system substrate-binding protein